MNTCITIQKVFMNNYDKLSIIQKLIEIWRLRPNDTLMQVYPSSGWPESIRQYNLRDFLSVVFNSNPKPIIDLGINSADEYFETIISRK
jgi:hypothetical protein